MDERDDEARLRQLLDDEMVRHNEFGAERQAKIHVSEAGLYFVTFVDSLGRRRVTQDYPTAAEAMNEAELLDAHARDERDGQ